MNPDGHEVEILGSDVTDPRDGAILKIWRLGEKLQVRICGPFREQEMTLDPSDLLVGVRMMADDVPEAVPEATARVLDAVKAERGRHRELWMDEQIPFSLDQEDAELGQKLAMFIGQIGRVAEHINQAEESLLPKVALIRLRLSIVEAAAMAVAWAESLPVE